MGGGVVKIDKTGAFFEFSKSLITVMNVSEKN